MRQDLPSHFAFVLFGLVLLAVSRGRFMVRTVLGMCISGY